MLAVIIAAYCFNYNTAFAAELFDPTRPPGFKTAYPSSHTPLDKRWILSSTLISDARRHAVINGKIVVLGEKIQQAKVVSIQPNEVLLLYNKKRVRIKMLPNKMKGFARGSDK